jgi:hypothetical protein
VVVINKGKIPWLKTSSYSSIDLKPISAGTSLEDFIKIIRASGGDVFVPAP